MKTKDICAINVAVLGAVLVALFLGAGFHQVNMNRKYWTMLRVGCINTNALVNLGEETGDPDMARYHMARVPRWIANINSTMRLGVLAVVIGIVINLFLMNRAAKKDRTAEQSAAPLPPAPRPGPSEGAR